MMERSYGVGISTLLRSAMVALLVLVQLFFSVLVSIWLGRYSVVLYTAMEVVAVVVAAILLESNRDSTFKIAWMIVVLIMPIVGALLYLAWGRGHASSREKRYREQAFSRMNEELWQDPAIMEDLAARFPARERTARFLCNHHFPAYQNTRTRFIPLGEDFFQQLEQDLERAEKFIFLEYFILSPGKVWGRLYEILKRKAAHGVDVRLLYDDAGCLLQVDKKFRKRLEADGIQVSVFGPVHRYVSELYLNYRNHQKIAVIDGNIGFVGGANIADEYANLFEKHGHWKDTCLRLEGDGVWGLTTTFLSMWDLSRHQVTQDYAPYRPTVSLPSKSFCQPFSDGPGNNSDNPAESLYCQLLSSAKRYCYLTSPYLVVDEKMLEAMRTAARSGVDVRLFTPSIPDHWYVHLVTRSYYGTLLENGVRIYEYTPGFIHAKMLASDDETAILGSINLDFRSFYLHYENAVYLVDDPSVLDIRDDILSIMDKSQEITYSDWKRRPIWSKLLEIPLRLFAPLM